MVSNDLWCELLALGPFNNVVFLCLLMQEKDPSMVAQHACVLPTASPSLPSSVECPVCCVQTPPSFAVDVKVTAILGYKTRGVR